MRALAEGGRWFDTAHALLEACAGRTLRSASSISASCWSISRRRQEDEHDTRRNLCVCRTQEGGDQR